MEDRSIRIINIDNIRWFNVGAGYAVNLSRGLRDLGHEVLFLGKDRLPPVREATAADIIVDNSLSYRAWNLYSDYRKLRKIIIDFKPDVINAHRPEGMNVALLARLLFGGDFIVTRTRVDIRPVRKNFINRWLYRHVDGVIAPFIEGRDHHLALGMEPERIAVLAGGVDCERFNPDVRGEEVRKEYSIPQDAPVVGLVARLDPVKGHVDFIEAARLVTAKIPDAHFMIIGDEVNVRISDLKSICSRLGLKTNVHFLGRRVDIERCVAALDVGVVASTGSEALSRVALEYMAAGKPVVATYVGGLPYIIEPGVNGILVPPHDPEQMAAAMVQALTNEAMRNQITVEALARVRSEFSLRALAVRTVEFFEKLMAMRRGQQ